MILSEFDLNFLPIELMSRTKKYTDMGWPEYGALWEYEVLSEPLLSSELSRLAFATQENDTHAITFQPSPDPDDKNQDRYAIHDWPLVDGIWQLRAVFDGLSYAFYYSLCLMTLWQVMQGMTQSTTPSGLYPPLSIHR
jgi:hypothetical protein